MIRRRFTALAALATLLSIPLLSTPRVHAGGTSAKQQPAGKIALRAARMVDVRQGTLVKNPIILIEGTQITAVGPNLAIPLGARVIDLGDATLLPGLIDCHTHLLHEYSDQIPNMITETARLGMARRALRGAVFAREMLEAGFTTVRDLGNSGDNGDVALRDAISAGWVVGPTIIPATRALSVPGGQFGPLTREMRPIVEQEYVPISGADEARRAVRQAVIDGALCIKVIVNAGPASPKFSPATLSLEEMRAIVTEAHRLDRKVAAHATGPPAVRICIDAGVDSIEHGYTLSEEELRLMARKKIFLVPTDEPNIPDQQERLRRAVKAGVRIAAGSDVYSTFQKRGKTTGQASVRTLLSYAQAGMSPLEVLRSATIYAAELVGFPEQMGVIEPGHLANMIAVPGNPLQDVSMLERVGFVMKEGKVYREDKAR